MPRPGPPCRAYSDTWSEQQEDRQHSAQERVLPAWHRDPGYSLVTGMLNLMATSQLTSAMSPLSTSILQGQGPLGSLGVTKGTGLRVLVPVGSETPCVLGGRLPEALGRADPATTFTAGH